MASLSANFLNSSKGFQQSTRWAERINKRPDGGNALMAKALARCFSV
jgi:hypothetical protein